MGIRLKPTHLILSLLLSHNPHAWFYNFIMLTSRSEFILIKWRVLGWLSRCKIVHTNDSLILGYWWQSKTARNKVLIPPQWAINSGLTNAKTHKKRICKIMKLLQNTNADTLTSITALYYVNGKICSKSEN